MLQLSEIWTIIKENTEHGGGRSAVAGYRMMDGSVMKTQEN
jgi:hypothetical protein